MNGLAPTRTGHCPYSSADQSQSSLRFRKCYPESNTGFSGGSIENALLSQSKVHRLYANRAQLGKRYGEGMGSVLRLGVPVQGFSPISLSDRAGAFHASAACIWLLTPQREQQAKPVVRQRLAGSARVRSTFDSTCQKENE
jgi:hypothetical protein